MKSKSVKIMQLVKDILKIRQRNLYDRFFEQKSAPQSTFFTVYQCESSFIKPIVDDTKAPVIKGDLKTMQGIDQGRISLKLSFFKINGSKVQYFSEAAHVNLQSRISQVKTDRSSLREITAKESISILGLAQLCTFNYIGNFTNLPS